jgi:hypothetical protein
MTACPNGHQNPHDYRFCGGCGAPIGAPTWATPSPQLQGSWPAHDDPPTSLDGPAAAPDGRPPHAKRGGWFGWPIGAQIATAAATLAILCVVISVFAVVVKGAFGADDSSTTAPDVATASTLDDWERAICLPGTFQDGAAAGFLPNATGTARCFSQGSRRVPLLIGQYSASFALENDMAAMRAVYATTTAANGETVVFLAYAISDDAGVQAARSALSPLTQFGFQIQGKP